MDTWEKHDPRPTILLSIDRWMNGPESHINSADRLHCLKLWSNASYINTPTQNYKYIFISELWITEAENILYTTSYVIPTYFSSPQNKDTMVDHSEEQPYSS